MKLLFLLFSLLFYSVLFQSSLFSQNNLQYKSFDSLKSTISYNFNQTFANFKSFESKTEFKFTKGDTFQLIGGVLALAFLSSVLIFRQDIFSTLPMSLLGTSILFIFLGSNMQ